MFVLAAARFPDALVAKSPDTWTQFAVRRRGEVVGERRGNRGGCQRHGVGGEIAELRPRAASDADAAWRSDALVRCRRDQDRAAGYDEQSQGRSNGIEPDRAGAV